MLTVSLDPHAHPTMPTRTGSNFSLPPLNKKTEVQLGAAIPCLFWNSHRGRPLSHARPPCSNTGCNSRKTDAQITISVFIRPGEVNWRDSSSSMRTRDRDEPMLSVCHLPPTGSYFTGLPLPMRSVQRVSSSVTPVD